MHSNPIHEKIIQEQTEQIVGIIIKKRKKKKISQQDLAEITGISRSTISRIESFEHIPTLPVVLSIFNALDITFDVK